LVVIPVCVVVGDARQSFYFIRYCLITSLTSLTSAFSSAV